MSDDSTNPKNNGAVLKISHIIKAVMSSAAKAELGALYIYAREAAPIINLLCNGNGTPATKDTGTDR